MATLALNNLASLLKVFGGNCIPEEGPLAIPVVLAFTPTEQEFVADLVITQQQHKVSYVQSIYVDNQFNDLPLDVFVSASQHLVTIPPYHQGFIALLAPNPPQITFGSAVVADTTVVVQLLNFPVSNIVWNTDPSFAQTPLNVTDPVLDALLVNGYMPVLEQTIGSGVIKPIGQADTFASLDKTTTASQNIIAAPGAGNQLWIEYINVSVQPVSTLAVAGDSILTLRSATTPEIARFATYIAAAAATVPGIADYTDTIYPRCRLADNAALTAILNTALTAGAWNIRVGYTIMPTV